MENILCVGDSLTFGARDEYHRSYPAELSRLFFEKEGRQVYCVNHGISGETSSELMRRILFNSNSCKEAPLALLLIGTNDTLLPQKEYIYKDNLRQIINILKEGDRAVGIGLLPPALGPGLLNYPQNAQTLIDGYNKVIESTANKEDIFVADFRGLGKFIIDTVHFNHAGYSAMADIWYDTIKKNTKF